MLLIIIEYPDSVKPTSISFWVVTHNNIHSSLIHSWNTKGGSITVLLTSCLTDLD